MVALVEPGIGVQERDHQMFLGRAAILGNRHRRHVRAGCLAARVAVNVRGLGA